jgi:hypothetical protein
MTSDMEYTYMQCFEFPHHLFRNRTEHAPLAPGDVPTDILLHARHTPGTGMGGRAPVRSQHAGLYGRRQHSAHGALTLGDVLAQLF